MTEVVLAADGTNLAHRAWHASRANPTAAISMVHTWLLRAARLSQSQLAVVCFDGAQAGSWRYNIIPGYKSGRKAKEQNFSDFLSTLPNELSVKGWITFTHDSYEADDALAALASEYTPNVALFTGDKDALAFAHYGCVIRPGEWEMLNADLVHLMTGVPPQRYRFYCAVKGDSSDCIPGVRSLGPKAALALAGVFASSDEFVSDLFAGGAQTSSALGENATAKLIARLDEVVDQVSSADAAMTPVFPPGITLGHVPSA